MAKESCLQTTGLDALGIVKGNKMKIKCTALAEEMGMEIGQLIARAERVLQPIHSKGKGKNTWFTEDGADLIRQSEEAPLTVAHRYEAYGIKTAPNPRWL